MPKLDALMVNNHKELNPKLWDEDQNLHPEVQTALLKIAKEFYEFLQFDAPLVDIQVTGSQANFNYSIYSDLDLHLIIPYDRVDCDEPVEDLFKTKRRLWKLEHDITIRGVPVEVYVEDTANPVRGSIYSILNDQWLREPDPTETEVDDEDLARDVKIWLERLLSVISTKDLEQMEEFKRQLSEYRKTALAKHGEHAHENLVFKSLRNLGVISELMQAINSLKDQELSVDYEQ